MLQILRIIRPLNLGLLAFALLGLLLFTLRFNEASLNPSVSPLWMGILLIYILCTVTASGYVINDLIDVKADEINKPHKQIVGKHISENSTKWLYFGLLIDTLLFAVFLSWFSDKALIFPIVSLSQLMLYIYSKYLKTSYLFGNIWVALLTASPYAIFAYVFDAAGNVFIICSILSGSAFLLNLIRELSKDWEDISGDSIVNAKTFPIVRGVQATKSALIFLITCSFLAHLALFISPMAFGETLAYTLLLLGPVILVIILHVLFFFGVSTFNWSPKKLSALLKIMMFLGVLWCYYLLIVF